MLENRWYKFAKAFIWVYQLVLRITTVVFCFTFLTFTSYFLYCLWDWRNPPVTLTLGLPTTVQRGQDLSVCLENVYRSESYSFKRDVSITDSDSHRFDFDEIEGYILVEKPSEYPRVCLDYLIPHKAAPGPAKIRYNLLVQRPGNIIDWRSPYILHIEKTIEIVS